NRLWTNDPTAEGGSLVRLFSKPNNNGSELALYRAAFEQNPDAIVVLRGATIVACNEAAVRQHGYANKADILALQTSDLAPEFQANGQRSSDYAREHLAVAAKEGFARVEWMMRQADGTTRPTQVTLLPVVLNGEALVISFRQDISDLVAMKQERKSA